MRADWAAAKIAYIDDHIKWLIFSVLKNFAALRHFLPCLFLFAHAQRSGLSGILS